MKLINAYKELWHDRELIVILAVLGAMGLLWTMIICWIVEIFMGVT